MKMRKTSKTGDLNSAFGIGCMRVPTKEVNGVNVIDEEKSIEIVRAAIDGGVTYVDTAYVYSDFKNEAFVGRALEGGYRERVSLATKLPFWCCNSADDMQRIFDEQLKNLQTDHIDYYLLHSLGKDSWEKAKSFGALEFLDKLKDEGKIRNACFSFHDKFEVFDEIIHAYDWDMCQLQYNIIDINNQAGTKGVELAQSLGVPVVVMEGLLGGRLANPPEDVAAIYDEYKEKRSAAEWAFRWLLEQENVATVLSGVNTLEQTEDNLRIFSQGGIGTMSEEEKKIIERVREQYEKRGRTVGCTGCSYCMPCPSGVDIPGTFRAYNDANKYTSKPDYRRYKKMASEGAGADKCVACGSCKEVCPQHLDIPELLKKLGEEMIK